MRLRSTHHSKRRHRAKPGDHHRRREHHEAYSCRIERGRTNPPPAADPRTLEIFRLAAPLRDLLNRCGLRFREYVHEQGSRYFLVRDPEDAGRTAILRVSDHDARPDFRGIASIHPGGDDLESARASLTAWLREGVRA